jgi:DNA-binding transcriptional regulator YiaG
VALRAWLGCGPFRQGTPSFCARLVLNLERRRPGQDVASGRARRISLRASCKASETAIFAGLLSTQRACLAPLQWADPNSPFDELAGMGDVCVDQQRPRIMLGKQLGLHGSITAPNLKGLRHEVHSRDPRKRFPWTRMRHSSRRRKSFSPSSLWSFRDSYIDCARVTCCDEAKYAATSLFEEHPMITVGQLRAARALLRIDQRALAHAANLSLPTIQRMEASAGVIRGTADSLMKLVAAIEAAGVQLINFGEVSATGGRGVRLRDTAAMKRARGLARTRADMRTRVQPGCRG